VKVVVGLFVFDGGHAGWGPVHVSHGRMVVVLAEEEIVSASRSDLRAILSENRRKQFEGVCGRSCVVEAGLSMQRQEFFKPRWILRVVAGQYHSVLTL